MQRLLSGHLVFQLAAGLLTLSAGVDPLLAQNWTLVSCNGVEEIPEGPVPIDYAGMTWTFTTAFDLTLTGTAAAGSTYQGVDDPVISDNQDTSGQYLLWNNPGLRVQCFSRTVETSPGKYVTSVRYAVLAVLGSLSYFNTNSGSGGGGGGCGSEFIQEPGPCPGGGDGGAGGGDGGGGDGGGSGGDGCTWYLITVTSSDGSVTVYSGCA